MKLRPLDDNEIKHLELEGIEIVPLLDAQRDRGIMIRDTITSTYLYLECSRYGQPTIYADLPKEVEIKETPLPVIPTVAQSLSNPEQPVV